MFQSALLKKKGITIKDYKFECNECQLPRGIIPYKTHYNLEIETPESNVRIDEKLTNVYESVVLNFGDYVFVKIPVIVTSFKKLHCSPYVRSNGTLIEGLCKKSDIDEEWNQYIVAQYTKTSTMLTDIQKHFNWNLTDKYWCNVVVSSCPHFVGSICTGLRKTFYKDYNLGRKSILLEFAPPCKNHPVYSLGGTLSYPENGIIKSSVKEFDTLGRELNGIINWLMAIDKVKPSKRRLLLDRTNMVPKISKQRILGLYRKSIFETGVSRRLRLTR